MFTARQRTAFAHPCARATDAIDSRFREVTHLPTARRWMSSILSVNK